MCHTFYGGGQKVGPELIGSGRSKLELEVSGGTPTKAGVDPRVLFIDRDPDDNVSEVEMGDMVVD